jgi:hypothetical protein
VESAPFRPAACHDGSASARQPDQGEPMVKKLIIVAIVALGIGAAVKVAKSR